ncbi:phage distal tail protein [Actinoplanes derwentensis]|uniref:Phage tail protein n=1 Tax=Actinoplanes derwentensis TaxID=113562 RepID=A0A1H2CWJ3_9ACTN|nr:phage tail domain-containing protein [Actinoplanes derwentensis]GID82026.1 hypothetical protein Ade03nite_09500 [Actinoplanes derwentensis]SDT74396.1 Phage tail protein [Actinoplanes derwentensis]
MPILAGGLSTTPVVETPSVVQPVWSEDLGTIAATWIDPDGTEWPLSNPDLGWFTMDGPAGWGSTPLEIVVDPLPRGGEQVRYIRSKSRRIQWPLYIGGDDHAEFVTRYRQLMHAFTATTQRGVPGWLRIGRTGSGRYRQIAAYYEEGWEGESGQNHLFAKPVVQLYCPDGFWSGDTPVVAARTFEASNPDPDDLVTFYRPFMSVTSSRLVSGGDDGSGAPSSTTVVNDGQVEAWPVWKLRGPFDKLTCVNLTTGARFSLTYNLAAGDAITITTNRPSVRDLAGVNRSRFIDWLNPLGTELWPLVPGANEIAFIAMGAGAGTGVEMTFTPRYETA